MSIKTGAILGIADISIQRIIWINTIENINRHFSRPARLTRRPQPPGRLAGCRPGLQLGKQVGQQREAEQHDRQVHRGAGPGGVARGDLGRLQRLQYAPEVHDRKTDHPQAQRDEADADPERQVAPDVPRIRAQHVQQQAEALEHEAERHQREAGAAPRHERAFGGEEDARVVEVGHQTGSTWGGRLALRVAARLWKVSGKGARRRHARPMVRPGGGDLKGRISTAFLLARGAASTASAGSRVRPSSMATIWRSVSRLVARTSSRPALPAPQTSSAWSRRQWPSSRSSSFSLMMSATFSTSFLARACPAGSAA